ncbi:MAG: DNA primase [Salinisphaeraceae bacterium]|nr:DNA primase [Salinisphaeraceae bacterium]
MAGRIPQNFIDDLIGRTDIVQLIDSYVPLKKAGREYQACCPFHDEKTPSFTVSPTKQFYHCFGCGAHGTALGFMMEYQRLEFRDAVEELARLAGVDVPEEARGPDDGGEYRKLLDLHEKAQAYFRDGLRNNPKAIEYLKGRGLNREVVNAYGIGYAPEGWSGLVDKLGAGQLLTKAGLAIAKDGGGVYDRFRDRIMFPIRDSRGRIIAYGGRTMGDDSAKYLNSPETPLFHKGRNLYGLYEAKQALKEIPRLLVVEGYMDVVALAQHGIQWAVATLGTATTEEHIQALAKVTPQIVFCFDGDRAGKQAGWRALERALPALRDGFELRFLFMPEGEDPDSLVRSEGADAFSTRVDQARSLTEYLLAELTQQVDMQSLDGKARLVELVRPYWRQLHAGALRSLLTAELADKVGLPMPQLEGLLQGKEEKPVTFTSKPVQRRREPAAVTPVRRTLQILLEAPELAAQVKGYAALRELELPGVDLVYEILELLQANSGLKAAGIIERWRGQDAHKHLQRLASMSLPVPPTIDELQDCINRLLASASDQRLQLLQSKFVEGSLSEAEKAEYLDLQRRRKGQSAAEDISG